MPLFVIVALPIVKPSLPVAAPLFLMAKLPAAVVIVASSPIDKPVDAPLLNMYRSLPLLVTVPLTANLPALLYTYVAPLPLIVPSTVSPPEPWLTTFVTPLVFLMTAFSATVKPPAVALLTIPKLPVFVTLAVTFKSPALVLDIAVTPLFVIVPPRAVFPVPSLRIIRLPPALLTVPVVVKVVP